MFIQAPHARFAPELTQITFLLLMLAFTNGSPARVEVVAPSAVRRHTSPGSSGGGVGDVATVKLPTVPNRKLVDTRA